MSDTSTRIIDWMRALFTSGYNRRLAEASSALVILGSANILYNEGFAQFCTYFVKFLRKLPFVDYGIKRLLKSQIRGAVKDLAGLDIGVISEDGTVPIPEIGLSHEEVLGLLNESKKITGEKAEQGKAFAYTYTTNSGMGDLSKTMSYAYAKFSQQSGSGVKEHDSLLAKAWESQMHSNALNPMIYKNILRLENDIVSMVAWMLHGNGLIAGSVTSGVTESILMAVKAYRDRAATLFNIKKPNMIASITIHPAFQKAADYFGVELIYIETRPDFRINVELLEASINENTILLIGSAPQYCHCVVDPIEELSALALKYNLPLHVDAGFGGFILPWLEKINDPAFQIPKWDFRVQGVTSISVDIHKYGFAPKGSSVILYRNGDLRSYQYFSYSLWPGGLFCSPSLAGSRSGGIIAASWAAIVGMGQNGYLRLAKEVLATTKALLDIIKNIEGIEVVTLPHMMAFAVQSTDSKLSIHAVAEYLEKKHGWLLERQRSPDSFHFSVMPHHSEVISALASALEEAVKYVKEDFEGQFSDSNNSYSCRDEDISNHFDRVYSINQPTSIIYNYLNQRHESK